MKKKISFIIPIFNESGNIDTLWQTLNSTTAEVRDAYDFEFVFINDGSRDDSAAKLIELHKRDKRVVFIDLSRNFGHQVAVTAGIDHVSGDAAIIMDADMQDPPRVALDLIREWQNGYDVVYAQRRSRKDTVLKRLTAWAYYALLEKMAEISIPRNTGDFRLIDRKVIEALRRMPEHNRYLRGMISLVGFKQKGVLFDRDARHAGETGYSWKKMFRFASDGIIGFSAAPIRLTAKLGFIISLFGFFGIIYAIVSKLFFSPVSGWTFMAISVFFMGGVQLLMLGMIGQYIARIHTETLGRPLYFIDQIYSSDHHGNGSQRSTRTFSRPL